MSCTNLNTLQQYLRKFAKTRNLDQFHSIKTPSIEFSAEVPEILSISSCSQNSNVMSLPKVKLVKVEVLTDTLNVFKTTCRQSTGQAQKKYSVYK